MRTSFIHRGLFLAVALVVCTLTIAAQTKNPEFPDVDTAMTALHGADEAAAKRAVDYLAAHPAQSVPRLMESIRRSAAAAAPAGRSVVLPAARRALTALARTGEDTAVTFLIDLLRNNFYAKEADGSRVRYGLTTKNGCIVMPYLFGGAIAEALGETGDKRAVPVLREAMRQGDYEVRAKARAALAKLGAPVPER